MPLGTLSQPDFDGGAALFVDSIGRVDVDRGRIPARVKSIDLRQPVLDRGVDDRVFVGARIQIHAPAKELPDGVYIFLERAPVLARRIDLSSGGHGGISKRRSNSARIVKAACDFGDGSSAVSTTRLRKRSSAARACASVVLS